MNEQQKPQPLQCRRCHGPMKVGVALEQTVTMGVPDFPGNTVESRGQTLSYGGKGRLIRCLKCVNCGWSMTMTKDRA